MWRAYRYAFEFLYDAGVPLLKLREGRFWSEGGDGAPGPKPTFGEDVSRLGAERFRGFQLMQLMFWTLGGGTILINADFTPFLDMFRAKVPADGCLLTEGALPLFEDLHSPSGVLQFPAGVYSIFVQGLYVT